MLLDVKKQTNLQVSLTVDWQDGLKLYFVLLFFPLLSNSVVDKLKLL